MTLLNQTCPHCQITEAMGGYCTSCERPTQPDWVHRKRLSEAQVATRATTGRCGPSTRAKSPRVAREVAV